MSDRFAIVIDGTASLPEEIRREHDIRWLPLHIAFGEENYTAGVDLSAADFYRKNAESKVPPTTSAPAPGECLDVYEAAARDGYRQILVLTLIAEKSVTNSVATMTAQQFAQARVEVVDSRSTAGGISLIATSCARLRREGGSFDDAVALARRLAGKVEILALIDTIDYLKRGGRVTGARAVLGSLLHIRPIVEVRGETEMIDRARTREKGAARLKELIEARVAPGSRIHACALHTNDPDRARTLGEWAQERFHCVEFWVAEAGPVIGTHAGPGVIGLCWYKAEDAAP